MNYLLDSNIVLLYLRNHKAKAYIETYYAPFTFPNTPILSVVTLGEIKSLAIRNRWGEKRIEMVGQFFQQCVIDCCIQKDKFYKKMNICKLYIFCLTFR